MFQFRKWIAPIIALLMISSSVIILLPGFLTPDTSRDHSDPNIITLLSQDYTELTKIPSNIFISNPQIPQTWNASLKYDEAKKAVNYSTEKGERGTLYIAGLTPMEKTTYHIEIGLERGNWNSQTYIGFPGGLIIYQVDNFGSRIIRGMYYNGTGALENISMKLDSAEDNKVVLDIILDTSNKATYRVQYNESKSIDVPWLTETRREINYDTFTGNFIYITNWVSALDAKVSTMIYKFMQSSPRSYITPLGATSLIPFGLDGPYPIESTKNGISAITNSGGRGTIWFDINYPFMINDNEKRFYMDLVENHSWEVGIHFSQGLNTLAFENATALMRLEFNLLTEELGMSPRTWCSLRNNDNLSHAIWAYDNLGLLWRNSDIGIGMVNNVGNLDTETLPWWLHATSAGLIMPSFTHRTDEDPAANFSINFTDFKEWIDRYTASGVEITSFNDWWMINSNTKQAVISDLVVEDDYTSFSIDTNGARSWVNVNYAANGNTKIVDKNGNIVSYSIAADRSLSFWAEDEQSYTIKE